MPGPPTPAACILGPSPTIPLAQGSLVLGSRRRALLVELDGPRSRNLDLTVVG